LAVLTLHQPSNVDSLDTLTGLLEAIDAVAAEVPIIFPVHPRTQQRLAQAGRAHHSQLRLTPPTGYLDFLCLLSKAKLVLTNSGSDPGRDHRAGRAVPHPP
jgi:UDP-N-acetylglucosamine 2-epimerase (non-hydrolysing)